MKQVKILGNLLKTIGIQQNFTKQNLVFTLKSEFTQSCPTLCNPMDCSLPGSEEPLSPWNFPDKSTGVGRKRIINYFKIGNRPLDLTEQPFLLTDKKMEIRIGSKTRR